MKDEENQGKEHLPTSCSYCTSAPSVHRHRRVDPELGPSHAIHVPRRPWMMPQGLVIHDPASVTRETAVLVWLPIRSRPAPRVVTWAGCPADHIHVQDVKASPGTAGDADENEIRRLCFPYGVNLLDHILSRSNAIRYPLHALSVKRTFTQFQITEPSLNLVHCSLRVDNCGYISILSCLRTRQQSFDGCYVRTIPTLYPSKAVPAIIPVPVERY